MYTILIPCKPYVKRFLYNIFGKPADLSANKFIYKYFVSLLDRQVHRNNKRAHFKQFGKMIYSEEVEIQFNEEIFERYGYDMNRTAVIDFNLFLEDYIKTISRMYILVSHEYCPELSKLIREFQDRAKFSEDDFSFETIKKDIQRNGKFLQDFFGTIVPDRGTVVPKAS